MWVHQSRKEDTKSPLQKLYEVIPGNLVEMTKKGLIKWTNLGCTLKSLIVLQDADVYEARFMKHKFDIQSPLLSMKIQLITSDDDSYLLLGENLISNAQVLRLKNYIQSQEKEDTSVVYRWMNSFNEELVKLYENGMKNFPITNMEVKKDDP